MRVRFPLAWIIQRNKKLNALIKEKNFKKTLNNSKPNFFYSFHFSSIFYPGSLKNINLFLRSTINREDNMSSYRSGTYKNSKVIVKQSYLLISWIHYLCKTPEDNLNSINSTKLPSFFIHPYKQSKITLIRSPLAHKTFSQEQFLNRHYRLSVSFKPNVSNVDISVMSVNGSVYASNYIRNNIPFISTNLLFLKRISYFYTSSDSLFFSYNHFLTNIVKKK